MKTFYTLALIACSLINSTISNAQCTGTRGPNLLGAKGTFSAPEITVNTNAANCARSGANTYNPVGNVGNALTGCTATIGNALPCSDYGYTSASSGLNTEFRYSILKTIGDVNGGNCIKTDWRGSDHTGDGGYFMAVNGAPNSTYSPVFYQIKSIPVCIGTTYEFSAYVLNILPGSSSYAVAGSQPNISFKVNGDVIANSGPIAYTNTPTWVKVGGYFTATTNTVDLQVVNATATAKGNDLGLDDISFNVCQSNIAVNGPASVCDGSNVNINALVTDMNHDNSWYKWQRSTNGGNSFDDISAATQGSFEGNVMAVPYAINAASTSMMGYKYRLTVASSESGLSSPECANFNEYTLLVNACGSLPVKLNSFTGRYSNGTAFLDWQTHQELNNDRFELFRSNDGEDFYLIATIASGGYNSSVKNYSYQDNGIGANKIVYYKLKQIDKDGKAMFSNIVKLSSGTKAGLDVFPNPFAENITVSFTASRTSIATIQLRNSTGQLVYTKSMTVNKGANSIVINSLPQMSTGLYYLQVTNEDMVYNSKLLKR